MTDRLREGTTGICTANADSILVRGADLCRDLIGSVSLTQMFWLLVTGERPSSAQTGMLDACLVAIAEHGLVPSVQAARMTFAAGPEAMQAAVAAGILGCGSVILGSAENAGRFFIAIQESAALSDLETAAMALVKEYREQKKPIPGYGHPIHRGGDPRVERLISVASSLGFAPHYVATARMAERVVERLTGKRLVLNVSGAIPAVLLDAGFPHQALKGVPILARTASLIAHIVEEQARPIGFILSDHAESGITYDGKTTNGSLRS